MRHQCATAERGRHDRHGHAAGDAVLRAVAATLRDGLRRQDHLARWGGEELLLLLPETDLDGAVEVAERLRLAVAATTVEHDGAVLAVTVTAGVAVHRAGGGGDDVIRAADRALYQGKAAGRDRVVAASDHPGLDG